MTRIDGPTNAATQALQSALVESLIQDLTTGTAPSTSATLRAALGGLDAIDLSATQASTPVQAPPRKKRKKGGLFRKIKKGFSKAFSAIGKGIKAITNPISSILGKVANTVTSLTRGVLGGVIGSLSSLPGFGSVIQNLFAKLF